MLIFRRQVAASDPKKVDSRSTTERIDIGMDSGSNDFLSRDVIFIVPSITVVSHPGREDWNGFPLYFAWGAEVVRRFQGLDLAFRKGRIGCDILVMGQGKRKILVARVCEFAVHEVWRRADFPSVWGNVTAVPNRKHVGCGFEYGQT